MCLGKPRPSPARRPPGAGFNEAEAHVPRKTGCWPRWMRRSQKCFNEAEAHVPRKTGAGQWSIDTTTGFNEAEAHVPRKTRFGEFKPEAEKVLQ